MPRRTRKNQAPVTEVQRAARAAREAKVQRVQLTLGYIIVGLSVVGGFVLSFWPQAFGLRETNPAVGFGLAALAGFRLYVLRREVRRQAEEAANTVPLPTEPKRRSRASAR